MERVYVSAVWGPGVTNYRVREAADEATARDDVIAHGLYLERLGMACVGSYTLPPGPDETSQTSACQARVYRHPNGTVRETGYWSQPLDRGGAVSTETQGAYLMRE